MSKTIKKTKSQKKIVKETFLSKFSFDEFIPPRYHILAAVLIIFILFLIFLNPLYFGNKTFQSGDIITSRSNSSYVEHHEGGYTLWNPYVFCGMPAYAIGTGFKWFNLFYVAITFIKKIFMSVFSVDYTAWTTYLIILGISSFFLVKYLTKNNLVSLFAGIASSFSTGIIVFLFIGHVTKLAALAFYPLIFLILLKFQNKIRLIDILILIITLQLSVQSFHVQIIFYMLFAAAIYYIYFFLRAIFKREKENGIKIIKSAGVFISSLIIALLIQSDNITQIYQYTPYSTRGTESILDKNTGKVEQNTSDYYKYHTDWSFSPEEVMTFIVPSYYGFGNSTYNGPLTNNQPVKVNTYFGQMPFVDVAVGYMGIIVFVLALFGIFTRWKEPFVQFLTILSGVALIISFGKNFPILFNLLFYHLPSFNKFRVPSMILVLVQLSIPILASLGLMRIILLKKENNEKLKKAIKNLAIGFLIIFVLSILLNGSISNWFISRVNDYAALIQQSQPRLAQQFNALAEYTANMFTTDFLFAFAFLTITFWGAVGFINSRISSDTLVLIIIFLTIIDLWRIDARGEEYIESPDLKNLFVEPDYVSSIKKQNEKEPFRILNLKQDGSYGSFGNNANYNGYFLLEDFYGYSAVKPRTYQDIIDVVGPANPTLWRMLNVRYLVTNKAFNAEGFTILNKSSSSILYKNENALPRIYFVDSLKTDSGLDLLDKIKNNSFDPKNIAFTEKEIKADPINSTVYANITEYKDESIKVNANASGNNFLFLGTTYLPYGWKAEIDGKGTKIYKANYGFMGVIVPKGKHLVEFTFAPASFYLSKYIALILSSIVIIVLIISLIKKRKDNLINGSA